MFVAIISLISTLCAVAMAYFAYRDDVRKKKETLRNRSQTSPIEVDCVVAPDRDQVFLSKNEISPSLLICGNDFKLPCLKSLLTHFEEATTYIEMRGFGSDTELGLKRLRIPIQELFTPLYVRASSEAQPARLNQRVSLMEAIESSQKVIMLGEPGSGKSTVMRYLVHNLSHARLLRDWSESVVSDENSPTLNLPVPLLLSASELQAYLLKICSSGTTVDRLPNEALLLCALDPHINADSGDTLIKLVTSLAQKGDVAVFIDGFDELPTHESIGDVETIVGNFARHFQNCKIVISSRPAFLEPNSAWASFAEIIIDGFIEPDIKDFVSRWTSAMLPDAPETQRKHHANALLSSITQNPHLLQLATNPVMLTCMAFLHYHRRALPASRAEILDSILQWLIRSRDVDLPGSSREGSRKEKIFQKLAFAMSNNPSGRRKGFGIGSAAREIIDFFDGNENAALEFLERERVKSGVIVPGNQGDIKFWHFWFQEYLTAKSISSRTDSETEGWWGIIAPHLDDPIWKEIISFIPACLARLGTDRIDLFYERLAKASAFSSPTEKSRRLALAGQSLRDLQFGGYTPPAVSVWNEFVQGTVQELERETTNVSLEDAFFAWVAYGICGDKRLINWEETWIDVLGGTILIGAQAAIPDGNNFDELATKWECMESFSVPKFSVRKYLITVQEFDCFVKTDAYGIRNFWTDAGWKWVQNSRVKSPDRWVEQLATPNCPVVGISFYEAQAYSSWLNETHESSSFWVYRLPHDIEWEFLAHNNFSGRFHWGSSIATGNTAEANWRGAGLLKRTPVGMFSRSNTVEGISDLYGNVEEWCESRAINFGREPRGVNLLRKLAGDDAEIVRGGSAIRPMRLCRPSYRSAVKPDGRYMTVGFRLARGERNS